MKHPKRLMGKAIHQWQMITEGDQIAVALSGGKDSSLLLYLLAQLQRSAPVNFTLTALHIDLGWGMDTAPLHSFCQDLEVELIVEKTQIAPILIHRREKNPCSLCANMRRGALYKKAQKLGLPKVALAHHLDDAIETLLLNMFYAGSIKSFQPRSYLDRTGVTIIRPLIYLPEKTIATAAACLDIPILPNPCPHGGLSRRQDIKELIARLETKIPRIRQNLLSALRKGTKNGLWAPIPKGEEAQRPHPKDYPY